VESGNVVLSPPTRLNHEIVVVGSGPGGAITACILAEAGKDVLLIEEGAFLNFVNWIGNVIAPVGAGVAVLGAVGSYATGRGVFRWLVTAAGLLAISGVTRLIEFWLAQGGGGIS
jgi:hypothetical protein